MTDTIDLHTHSTASDGSLTPTELVTAAKNAGLKAMAITDHDTADGVAEALEAGKSLGYEVVPGIELSTDLLKTTVHILGYFIDPNEKILNDNLEHARAWRRDRNSIITGKFNQLGIPMKLEEVAAIAGGDVVGRPHFARWLLEHGYVRTIQEAFDIYLDRSGKAYVDKFRFTPQQASDLIHGAGGLMVLAHPSTYKRDDAWLNQALDELKSLGLDGLETYYSLHSEGQTEHYRSLAQKRGLLITGGTDFHGKAKPDISLGVGKGNLSIPYHLLEKMKSEKIARQG